MGGKIQGFAMKPNLFVQCPFCVMDTTDPEIQIDETGCTYCKRYKENIPLLPKFQVNASLELERLVDRIKNCGKNRAYDCLIGVSGGVDSSYVAYYVKEILGLRPLAVHLDNGWNDELAIFNIEKLLRKLDIDLWTEVLDWDEFRSLQLSFLKASVPDCEIPTDHAISASLYKAAKRFNIKYIVTGYNAVTESIMPSSWSRGHADWKYISGLNRKYGTRKLRRFPHYTFLQFFWRQKFSSIKAECLLSYMDFNKKEAVELLEKQLGWQPYSGKHHESIYTKFYQAYWLPRKFGFDKRKGHLSALICAGQIRREDAMKELDTFSIPEGEVRNLKEYVADKFEITQAELDTLFSLPNKTFYDFPSHYHSWQFFLCRFAYRCTLKPLLKALT